MIVSKTLSMGGPLDHGVTTPTIDNIAQTGNEVDDDGDGTTGDDNDDDNDGGDNDDGEGDGALGSGMAGYDNDDDGDGRQQQY
jgi:hypothetical protein